jgi:hypothetical protein
MIASFFPETTVMFADISGFTAWASTREPVQVFPFQLLETIYGAFDEIARRKGIFKVETVGDCYVSGSIWKDLELELHTPCSFSSLSPWLCYPTGCRSWGARSKIRPCDSYGALCS